MMTLDKDPLQIKKKKARRDLQKIVWPILLILGVLGNVVILTFTPNTLHRDYPRKVRHSTYLDFVSPAKKVQNRIPLPSAHEINKTEGAFSFCLLIKDDNDILNEWIAYHYHTLKLRTLIVAIDPSSKTTPQPLLEKWNTHFSLNYEIWDDSKYMPNWFLQKKYNRVPRMIKWQDKNASKWHEEGETLSQTKINTIIQEINNHRFRQSLFLQRCAKELQERNETWVTHIDTDEYIFLNPNLRHKQFKRKVRIPSSLQENSLFDLLQKLKYSNWPVNWPCISIPRVMYGSVEKNPPPVSNHKPLETLRWKYHTDYKNDQVNKQPKAIMDVSGFPEFQESKKAFSIHRPNMELCRRQGQMDIGRFFLFPLTINHYLGSIERYLAREDTRRTTKAYNQIAIVQDGKDDNWIDTWWPSFVTLHGAERVSKVMWRYMDTHGKTTQEQVVIGTDRATRLLAEYRS